MQEALVSFVGSGAEPIRLEGLLHAPAGKGSRRPAVVLCHPHSLHGGSMDVPIIVATARELAQRGMFALRFNLRGVGRSEGGFGDGISEVADVEGAVDFLRGRSDVDESRLYLMGYSFGAAVGLRYVEEDPDISAIAVLCLPLGEMTLLPLDDGYWRDWRKPKLFLAGTRDDICPLSDLRALVDQLPEPKKLIVLQGADHFLWGREREVAGHIAEFLGGLS
jgi:alpha/beta superfamily hydrolase